MVVMVVVGVVVVKVVAVMVVFIVVPRQEPVQCPPSRSATT